MNSHDDISQTRVVFFHVSDATAKLKHIYETARFHFGKKEPFLFIVEDEKAQKYLDELLWKFQDTSFLPHIASDEPCEDRIVITKAKSNVNQARFVFNLCPTPLLIAGFKVIYDFEDVSAPTKKSFSILRFNAYKQAKMGIESRTADTTSK